MKKVPTEIFHSFEEADKRQLDGALAMKPADRVDAVDIIRRRVYMIKGVKADNIVARKFISYEKREN